MESYDWAIQAYSQGAVFTAFDIETTGLDPKRDRIVEFGALKFDRRGVIARYATLINPGVPMPPEAGRVNGISDKMLAGQPSIAETLPDFLRFAEGTVLIAHNAPFDCGFVNETLARLYGSAAQKASSKTAAQKTPVTAAAGGAAAAWTPPFSALPNKTADTLLMARRLLPGRNRYSLQELARGMGIKSEEAHRALDDARLCMEIFTALCESAGA